MRIIVFALILVSSVSQALEQFVSNGHIVISKDLSYPARKLCHDGNTVYLKMKKHCHSEIFADCFKPLAPMYEVERITAKSVSSVSIDRFFAIPIQYTDHTYTETAKGSGRFVLTKAEEKQLSLCHQDVIEDSVVHFHQRHSFSQKEESTLLDLHSSLIPLVNAPSGVLDDLKKINKNSRRINVDEINIDPNANISTPFCAKGIDRSLVEQLGGEMSGNGRSVSSLVQLESLSEQVTRTRSHAKRKVRCRNEVSP